MDIDEKLPPHLSTHQTAKLLGVDMTTIIGWCEQGKIKAFKTPGGHRRIKVTDLIQFLNAFKMPIPDKLISASRLCVLVVDDEPGVRRMVSRILKSSHPEADILDAADGFEAGQKVIEFKPRLLILDLNLPGINGFGVCKRIRKDESLHGIKILAITGEGSEEVKNRILDAGADDYLGKPFNPKDLKDRVNQLLEQ